MKELIFKDKSIEVFKTENKKRPFILEVGGEKLATFVCKEEEISYLVPDLMQSISDAIMEGFSVSNLRLDNKNNLITDKDIPY